MESYNNAPPGTGVGGTDAFTSAQNELNAVKSIMVQNVESILSRGERIELLVDKTDNMASQATAFRRGARVLRRKMWWRDKKMIGLSVLVALVRAGPPPLFFLFH
jgi:vesicle-associated membrane protein 7